MKKQLLFLFALVFSLASTQAQRVLLDFETESQSPGVCFGTGGEDNTDCYSTIANPDPSGENTTANVLEFIEPAGGEPWMGMFFDITSGGDMDLTTATGETQLCADVWVPNAVGVTFKVEQSENDVPVREYEAPAVIPSTTGAWTTVCADMSAFNNTGNRFVLFFNIGAVPANPVTYYFDNLIQSGVSSVGGLIEAKGLKFYPNPATHNLFFNADGEPMTVIVSDLSGREMIRYNNFTDNNIRVSDLTPGMYTITFVDEATGQYGTAKFSKM
jgi:hypothetical protein